MHAVKRVENLGQKWRTSNPCAAQLVDGVKKAQKHAAQR